jgi:uroporphyrinogen-III synthase
MRRILQQIVHSLPSRAGRRLDRSLRPAGTKRAQFVSFLESSGYRTHDVDAYERSLRRRRAAKAVLVWATAFAVAWVVLESARAVSMF